MSPEQPPAQPEPFPREPIPPELKELALSTFDMDAFLAGMKEIRETGGLAFDDFIEELERKVLGRE